MTDLSGDGESSVHTEEGEGLHASSPFFADATLDLDTAHDLAETPDASQNRRRTVAPPPEVIRNNPALLLPTHEESVHTEATIVSGRDESPTRRRLQSNTTPGSQQQYEQRTQQQTDVLAAPLDAKVGTTTTIANQTNDDSDIETPEKPRSFARITHLDNSLGGGTGNSRLRNMRLLWSSLPKKSPTWPRDWTWAVAFVVIVPLALVAPLYFAKPKQLVWTHKPLSNATLGAWWVSAAAAAVTMRWMYARRWNSATDEDRTTRHERIAAHLVSFAAWSVVVYLLLALTILIRLPQARWAALLPLAYTVRDVYLVRRWKQRRGLGVRAMAAATLQRFNSGTSSSHASSQVTTGSAAGAASYASRYAFFKALVAMALDILTQSLRRASFWRVLSFILIAQTFILWLWRRALIGALDDESVWLLLLAALGGKWATGTLARLLSLIASGGVVNWFVQQQQQHPEDQEEEDGDFGGVEMAGVGGGNSQVPEAYRTVGASVYESVLRLDDIDEDDEDDEEEFLQEMQQDSFGQSQESLSTVQGLLAAGMSVSFGSVAMCGLLGGPAQFVWSQIRKVNLWQEGQEHIAESLWEKVWNRILLVARSFVRNYSDLAMSHVAAYYKPYSRAARDVTRLIEEAGLEVVLHDDITTHMCSCVGGTVSGAIVLLTGHFAQRHRVANGYADDATDLDVVKNMLLAFILSYTLLFTVMEPLRAAIKAVYCCFAQNPRSLSHVYPLIYHRLARLSEANLS